MEKYAADHPMTLAWLVLAGEREFDCLAQYPKIQRDTAISVVLDDLQPTRKRASAAGLLTPGDAISAETCDWLLDHETSPMIRREAISGCNTVATLLRRLERDSSWLVRTKALERLVGLGLERNSASPPSLQSLRVAADDPHWRVRAALVHAIEKLTSQTGESADWSANKREQGVVAYLNWRRGEQENEAVPPADDVYSEFGELRERPWWENDPRKLLAHLKKFDPMENLADVPRLVGHPHEAVRGWAFRRLLDYGSAELCQEAAQQITDTRHPGWNDRCDFLRRLDPTRRPPEADGDSSSDSETSSSAMYRLAELSPDHPYRRDAYELKTETCWHTLRRCGHRPSDLLADLPPELPAKPSATQIVLSGNAANDATSMEHQRQRLAISGHYHLPSEHYSEAFDLGMHTFFWEPNYASFNRFMGRLSPADRRRIRMIAGTFEAEPKRIEKDVDRALKLLQIERLDSFMMFWVRSESRLGDEVRDCLEQLVEAKKVNRIGFSTHQRSLAIAQIESSDSATSGSDRRKWDSVMVRHNLAHRGAEQAIFPTAIARGQHLITFSSTCYGRLIAAGASARDCLRYSLHDPAVKLVLTAPATSEQLTENCSALDMPALESDQIEALRAIGDQVYRENKAFESWIRSR